MNTIPRLNSSRSAASLSFALFVAFLLFAQLARAQQTVVANYTGNSLLIVDLSTGARTTLSDASTGTGTNLSRPVGLGRESNGTILVGQDLSNSVLFRVDPVSGNRTVLSSNTVGTGPSLGYIYGIAVDGSGNIYTSNFTPASIVKVDGTTGNRTVVSSATVGSGATWSSSPWGIAAEPDGNLIVAMYSLGALYRVDPTTGARTVISSSTVGTGPSLVNPTGIARLSDGTIMVVNRDAADYIIRVDPTTGNRTVVSSSTVGIGATISTRFTISYDTNGTLYTADFSNNAVLKIDPTTGNRTIVSNSVTGSGPNFASPLGILPNAVASISSPGNPPVVSSASTASATYGSPFSYTIAASNTPTSYSAPGLPTGLSLDTTSGAITGTPTQSGLFTVTLGATNSDGTGNATLTLTVAKLPLTVSGITATTKAYDQSTAAMISATNASLIGVLGGDTVTLDASNASGTFDSKNVGTGKTVTVAGLTLGGASASDYTLTQPTTTGSITPKAATVSGIAATDKTYDGTAAATLVATGANLNGIVTGDTVSLDVSSATGTFDSKAAGTGKTVTIAGLALTGADAGNYAVTQPTATANITPKAITVTGVTALDKAYDATTAATLNFAGATLVGVIPADDLTLVSSAATGSFASAVPGMAQTVTVNGLTLAGADSANYTLTAPTLTANVTKPAAIVTLAGLAQAYDGTPRVVTATTTPAGLAVAITYDGSSTAPSARGTYTVVATISDANYQGSATGTLTIGKMSQTITFNALSDQDSASAPIVLHASASSGLPVSFAVVSGPASISGNTITLTGAAGEVTVTASQAGDNNYLPAPDVSRTFAVASARTDRLINLSSRARVSDNGERALISGFVIGGTEPKRVLLRAVGPTLSTLGVTDALADPRLRLFDGSGHVLLENDDWSGAETADAMAQTGAFSLPAGSHDAAVVTTLAPGAYTMLVMNSGQTGTVLAEVYDASAQASPEFQRLINISSRGMVDINGGPLIGGFIITGNSPKKVLIRGAGPSLASQGISHVLADPKLKIYDGAGVVVAQDDDWGTPGTVPTDQTAASSDDIVSAEKATGAFAFPDGSKDAALIVTLPPGAHTAVLSGSPGTTGVALVEIYEMP